MKRHFGYGGSSASSFGLQRGFSAVVIFIFTLVAVQIVSAQKVSVVHSFGSGMDGVTLYGGVITDNSGNIYGTTSIGGQFHFGTVFEITPSGQETILWNFTGGTDGEGPQSGLIRDAQGNLYGTTELGGKYGQGTVFEITGTTEKTLWSFGLGEDGNEPTCALIRDGQGNLYGTTTGGGQFGFGVVFRVTPSGNETMLHSFAGPPTDGASPLAGLVTDGKGNGYGTTNSGGSGSSSLCQGCGTVFKLSSNGAYSVIYNFQGPDGAFPTDSLIVDTSGNLFGTTFEGGTSTDCSAGCGTVFEVFAAGGEKALYSFKGLTIDGGFPYGGLVRDPKGNFYGTTYSGGEDAAGTIFEVTPTGTEHVIYSFGSTAGDGFLPHAGLTSDGKGGAYGTTQVGGQYGQGTVYNITP